MNDTKEYADVLEESTQIEWAFGLNTPAPPEGDGEGYQPPAEAYLEKIAIAQRHLQAALQVALAEIPDPIRQKGDYLSKIAVNAAQELSTQEPEVRRLWAVKAAHDLVSNLYEALHDEARPSPRVTLPKLARKKRS